MIRSRLWQSVTNLAKCQLNRLTIGQKMQWNIAGVNPNLDLVRNYSGLQRNLLKNFAQNNLCRPMWTGTSRRDDSLPKLVYFQYPWKYLKARLGLFRLKYFWDPSFREEEFKKGSKQAAVVIADLIRNKDLSAIQNLTTPSGFKQIARDVVLSRQDPRLKLLKFRSDDIQRAIPIRVYFVERNHRKHCIIDMFFVGMRNVNDFEPAESNEIQEYVKKYDEMDQPLRPSYLDHDERESYAKGKRRIVFAEIFTRFYREYGMSKPEDWAVAFYKVASFDVLAI